MKRRRVIQRVLVLMLLLLGGGAVANVAVAWGCAGFVSPKKLESIASKCVCYPTGDQWWVQIDRAAGFGTERFEISEMLGKDGDGGWGAAVRRKLVLRDLPPWCRLGMLPDGTLRRFVASKSGHGWPFIAMYCNLSETWWRIDDTTSVRRGQRFGLLLPTSSTSQPDLVYLQVLPIALLWPGFAINTMFYAAVLWMLFTTPLVLRRWRRRRRSLCPKCGYDLRGRRGAGSTGGPYAVVTCPECGATR